MTAAGGYCKAYLLRDLRACPGWREPRPELDGETVVFLHDDHSVTAGIFHGEDVLLAEAAPDWIAACRDRLGFTPAAMVGDAPPGGS